MVYLTRDIHSLTDSKRNTSDYVKQLKDTKSPVVLTVNGKAELVVQDAASYQSLLDIVDRIEAIEGIREGLEDMRVGRTRSTADVFADIRKRHNAA